MPALLSDKLRRSLEDRTKGFRSHVEDIALANLGAPRAFHDALELVKFYISSLLIHTQNEWAIFDNDLQSSVEIDVARQRLVKKMLWDLAEKEREVDELFGRGGHSAIPRSLSRRIEKEFRLLGMHETLRPVLTVGPPGNFETHKADFRGFLFRELYSANYEQDPRFLAGNFAFITVPYLEGTRAFWEPIVVGHELAHIYLFYRQHGVRPTTRAYATGPTQEHTAYLDGLLLQLQISPRGITRNWLEEFLCDLNAYRLYGPAALAAVAEMLAVYPVGEAEQEALGNQPSDTHPPRSSRIELLQKIAELTSADLELGTSEDSSGHASDTAEHQALLDTITSSWPTLSLEAVADPRRRYDLRYLTTFISSAHILWKAVREWGPAYSFKARVSNVLWLSRRLQAGVPGGLPTEMLGDSSSSLELSPPDVINAAWAAEERKQDDRLPSELPIDALSLKALDNLAFADLWSEAIDRLAEPEHALEATFLPTSWLDRSTSGATTPAPPRWEAVPDAGILSGADILSLLEPDCPAQHRLIVTPMLNGAVREAALDIRLSSTFIVFKHSAARVFDAISGDQDPREIQETVDKEWGDQFILHPQELVLAATLEYLVLPANLAGEIASRSSYGRLGLVSVTASRIQPSSVGCLTLELVNTSRIPIALTVGERIAQIIFQRVPNPVPLHRQTYRWPTGPQFSQIRDDWDRRIIRGFQDIINRRPPKITPRVAYHLFEAGQCVIYDVRQNDEWDQGHISGARHIVLGSIPSRLQEIKAEARRVVVVSRSSNRASQAATQLRQHQVDAFVMEGGMRTWTQAGFPVVNDRKERGVII